MENNTKIKKGELALLLFGALIVSAFIGAGISLIVSKVFDLEYQSICMVITMPIFVAGGWLVLWPHKPGSKFANAMMELFSISIVSALAGLVISWIIGSVAHNTALFVPAFFVAWGIIFGLFVTARMIPRWRRFRQGSAQT